MAFVEFKDVRKIYHMGSVEVRAVDGMDFEIEEGELCVIVGPSGAGKTTVLNMLGGMDSCTSGIITLDGKDVGNLSERERTLYRRHDIGFVFQFYNLVQNLTALENVELATQICKNPMNPMDALAAVGLAERKDSFPSQLSGGQQQRVSIARALAKNPHPKATMPIMAKKRPSEPRMALSVSCIKARDMLTTQPSLHLLDVRLFQLLKPCLHARE